VGVGGGKKSAKGGRKPSGLGHGVRTLPTAISERVKKKRTITEEQTSTTRRKILAKVVPKFKSVRAG